MARRGGWAGLARKGGGWTLVLAGVAGLVLPVIPGVPLLLGGLAMLAVEYAWARLALRKVKGWVARLRGKKTAAS